MGEVLLGMEQMIEIVSHLAIASEELAIDFE